MAGPEISIILPVYNAADYLGDALRSIVGQTFESWECLVVDDGSADGSLAVAERIAAGDERVKVISRQHEGLVAAQNAGLEQAAAPLVARMDADDISLPERLKKQYDFMRSNPEVTLCGCLVRSFPEESVGEGMLVYERWLNSLVAESEIQRDFFVESPFAHPSVVFRRGAVSAAGGYQDNGWPEDYDLWMRLLLSGARFAKMPETLYLWRDYPGRLSRTGRAYTVPRFKKLKAHYLLRSYLRERRVVTIWGAGREGRWWCRELSVAGVSVNRFIDVDPKKIGRGVGDIPILAPDALKKRDNRDFILGAVGARGARPIIREQLLGFGYTERDDFLFLA